jgi:hypothetical protein
MTELKIELGKDDQYQTRDGRAVRILAVDAHEKLPVVALLQSIMGDGNWALYQLPANGRFLQDQECIGDIILKPVVREFWVNLHASSGRIGDDMRNLSRCIQPCGEHALDLRLRILYRECDIKNGVIELRSWGGE